MRGYTLPVATAKLRVGKGLLNLLVDKPVPGVPGHISEVGWLICLVIHGLGETLQNF